MKQALSFIKDRIITGVIIIVPIAIVIILFKDSLKKLMDLTIPLTSKMDIGGPLSRTVMASVLIVVVLGLVFFICGLILKTYYGGRFKKWLEQSLLDHIPFFSTLNSVVHQITGVEKGNYGAVEFSQGDTDNVLLGIHTDTLPDGRFVIFAPFAPLVNIGQIYLVPQKNVKLLDIKLKDFVDIVSKVGFEAHKVYAKEKETK